MEGDNIRVVLPTLYQQTSGQPAQLQDCDVARGSGRELSRPSPVSVYPQDEYRKTLIRRLSKAIEKRFGIYPNETSESKLSRLFLDVDGIELNNWVSELEGLAGNHARWLSLVSNLTVHETYFFRDRPQLDMLRKVILPELIKRAAKQPHPSIRIWSAACSTGEEVYTLAMLVLDVMRDLLCALGSKETAIKPLPGWHLEVLGTDISAVALKTAQEARYANAGGLDSFRSMDSQWQDYFELSPENDKLVNSLSSLRRPKDFVRSITRFEQYNLLQDRGSFLYDLVLCRNALIYFKEGNKSVAQRHLLKSLKPQGTLLLGPADPMVFSDCLSQRWLDGLVYYVRT